MSYREKEKDLREWLAECPCDPSFTRDEWVKVGMGLKAEGYEVEDWMEWSRPDTERYSEKVCRDTWKGFNGKGIRSGTVITILREHGATGPNWSNAAQTPRRTTRKKVTRPGANGSPEQDSANELLIKAANENLQKNPEAQDLVRKYLATHIGITPEEAALRGLGVCTPALLNSRSDLNALKGRYGHNTWLTLPAQGARGYFVSRLVPGSEHDGWEGWTNAEYKAHGFSVKAMNPAGIKRPAITNPGALKDAERDGRALFVVEGIQDQLAIAAHGFKATATLGTDYKQAAVKALGTFKGGIVIMFDNDESGRKAGEKLAEQLEDTNTPCIVFAWQDTQKKDPGEWNGSDPDALSKALSEAEKEALKQAAAFALKPAKAENKEGRKRDWRAPVLIGDIESWLKRTVGKNGLAFNVATQEVCVDHKLPWDGSIRVAPRVFDWEVDGGLTLRELQNSFNKNIADANFRAAIRNVAMLNAFDPVKTAIRGLPKVEYRKDGSTHFAENDGTSWTVGPLYTEEDLKDLGEVKPNGEGGFEVKFNGASPTKEEWFALPRVAGFVLWKVLKADLTPLTFYSELTHLIGVIARGLHHGCNYQYALIVQGKQGIGKDAYLGATAIDPNRFCYDGNFENALKNAEDEMSQAAGNLIYRLQEIAASNGKGNVNKFKSFVSKDEDTINIKYVPRRTVPRSYVIASSSNDFDLLNDPTGNRRFLIIECRETKNLNDGYGYENLLRLVRGSLAEIYSMHEKTGWEAYKAMLEVPYFIRTAIEKQAARFSVIDPVSEKINGWLDENSPELVCVEQAATESGAYEDKYWNYHKDREGRTVSNILNRHPAYEYMRDKRTTAIKRWETGKSYGKVHYWQLKAEYRPN